MVSDGSPGISDYLAVLRRRRLLIVKIALPIVLIAVVLALALPDVYRSSATFRLVSEQSANPAADATEFADQYVMALAERVLTSANLSAIVRATNPYPALADDESAALAQLRENVRVQMTTQVILEPSRGRERNVNTGFVVAFDHPAPEAAQSVAKELADAFIELSRAERLTLASSQVKFYAGEAERTSKEIAEYERQLAEFKEANFERLPETAQTNITLRGRMEQELDNVDREIRGLQQNRVFVSQQLRQAQAGPTATNLPALEIEFARKAAIYSENHPDVVTLRRQIESLRAAGPSTGGNTLQAQLETAKAGLAEASQRYSADHPDIRRMQRNIEALEARIAAGESPTADLAGQSLMAVQLQTQMNAMDTQIAGLQGRGSELRNRLVQFESRLGSTPEVEREYQAITRGLDTARAQFNQMIGRRMDAEVQTAAITGGAADRFKLESVPRKPWEPVRPKRLAMVVIGLIIASIVALSGVVTAEALDPSVRGTGDVRRTIGRAPLAVVPKIHNSAYWRTRTRRAAKIAASVVIATPVLYLLVYMVSRS